MKLKINKEMNNLSIVLEQLVRITLGPVMFISTLLVSVIVLPFYLATLVISVFQKPSRELVYVKVPVDENR